MVDSLESSFDSGTKNRNGNCGCNSNGSSSHKMTIGTSGGRGQTHEHFILSRELGVTKLIAVINKLNCTYMPLNKERYNEIHCCLTPLIRASRFVVKRIQLVPVNFFWSECQGLRGKE